jgi:hypothetical protein
MDAETISKIKSDFQTYIEAGFNLTWIIARIVADYRLWNHRNEDVFIDGIMEVYSRLPDRTKHIYM